MAAKPKPMSLIKQLLRLHSQGAGKKHIARTLKISRNTVKAYLDKIASAPLSVDQLLALDDHKLEPYFHAGTPAYKHDRFTDFAAHSDYFVNELRKPGVTRKLLWQEYCSTRTDYYAYSQFCELLARQLSWRTPSMVLSHDPADKLFFDFAGKTMEIVDPHTGEITAVYLFVACLPYSDYAFAMAVRTQGVEDVAQALTRCLSHLGGVPKALVPDNMKSAVIKANRYEPGINSVLQDLANHYGMCVSPARVRHPKDKALVENQVKLMYQRVVAKLRNQVFHQLEALNAAIADKVREHNQTRMQQKPYSRQECFIAEEKPLLNALPQQPFQIRYSKTYKVAPNNHIYLGQDKHYYSVPYRHIGKKVLVMYTHSMVHIFDGGQLLAVHSRDRRPGRYSTIREHLCSAHQHYLNRSPQYYLERADKANKVLGALFERIFDQNYYPETLYNRCEGLLALCRKTPTDAFERACTLAITLENYTCKFVENVLKNNMIDHQQDPVDLKKLPRHDNIRGAEHYQQTLNLY
jgi:transposase